MPGRSVYDQRELVKALQHAADQALWSAIRTLEDQAAYARFSEQSEKLPRPPAEYAKAAEHAEVLRSLLRGSVAPSG